MSKNSKELGVLGRSFLDWAVAQRAVPGQQESGDRHLAKVDGTNGLVAVVDGLGHGEPAATAAKIAIAALEYAHRESPVALMQRCHEALRSTRGAVVSLALFNRADNTMTWLGVGNVEGLLLHRKAHMAPAQEGLLLRAGLVGDFVPQISPSVIRVGHGDLLILATDGIKAGFADNLNMLDPPQKIANRILTQHARETDDALVLVARYLQTQGHSSTR